MTVSNRPPQPRDPPVIVLAPDKFRGSLAAPAICAAMARGLRRVWPQAEVRSCPMADGGEGTLDAVMAGVGSGGRRHVQTASGAGRQPIEVACGIPDGTEGATAIIEVAQIVGIADRAAGSGAAGGLGFGLQMPGRNVSKRRGVRGGPRASRADWLLTGEGRSDAQTLAGKAPLVAARRARAAGVPATLISGALDSDALPELGRHFAGCFAIPASPSTMAACIAEADALIADRVEQLARLWTAART